MTNPAQIISEVTEALRSAAFTLELVAALTFHSINSCITFDATALLIGFVCCHPKEYLNLCRYLNRNSIGRKLSNFKVKLISYDG